MSNRILSLLSVMALASTAAAEVAYEFAPNFITPPPGKETIGDGHGEIAVDSAGLIYVSVQDEDPALGGLQVYGKNGQFIKTLPLPSSLHGFVIRKLGNEEHIYAAVLGEARVIKCNLDGTVVMEIPTSAFPAEQRDFVTVSKSDDADPKKKTTLASGLKVADTKEEITLKLADGTEKKIPKEKGVVAAGGLKLTNCDVAPNGDIYVVDGYGRSFIFVFSADGKYKSTFGGPDQPLSPPNAEKPLALANAHKIFIDKRFEPARVMICDRGHKRMLHTDLDGKFIAEIATDMRNPSSASFHGDLMCVAEIAGNVSVWDKANKRVADLGTSPALTNTPGIAPKDWQQGIVTSPHGITFDNDGNILETEWNKWGRVLRWNVKK